MEAEEEESNTALPEDLVEQIVARVAFPSIFKFRGLSKAWRTRFSSILSLNDEAEKRLAISFQKLVSECSNNWETFYPICVGKENSFAYDRVSHVWRRLPALSFLPNISPMRTELQVDENGAQFFVSHFNSKGELFATKTNRSSRRSIDTRKNELYVANILTRSWKRLAPSPNRSPIDTAYVKAVTGTSFGTCRLILFLKKDFHFFFYRCDYCWAHIYDCKLDAWSIKRFVASTEDALAIGSYFRTHGLYGNPTQDAFLNGVLYMSILLIDYPEILAFDVEGGTLKVLRISIPSTQDYIQSFNLVGRNANLLMVAITAKSYRQDQVIVCKIDLESLDAMELARSPADLIVQVLTPPVSDGNRITFRAKEGRVLEYNVVADEWSLFTGPPSVGYFWERDIWLGSSFKPGSNPFGDFGVEQSVPATLSALDA